jgi:hypothetical protein
MSCHPYCVWFSLFLQTRVSSNEILPFYKVVFKQRVSICLEVVLQAATFHLLLIQAVVLCLLGGQALVEPPPRTSAPSLSPWAARLGLGGSYTQPKPPPKTRPRPPPFEPADPAPPQRGPFEGGDLKGAEKEKREPQRRSSLVDYAAELGERLRGDLQKQPGDPFQFANPASLRDNGPPDLRGFRGDAGQEGWKPSGSEPQGFEGLDRPVFHPGFAGNSRHPPFQNKPFAVPHSPRGSKDETSEGTFRVPRSPTVRSGPFKLPTLPPNSSEPFAWPLKAGEQPLSPFANPFLANQNPNPKPERDRSRPNPFVAALQGNLSLSGPRIRAPESFGARPPPHPKPFESFGKWGAPAMQFPFPPGQGFFGRKSPDSSKGGSSTSPQEAARGLRAASQSSGGVKADGFYSQGGAQSAGFRGDDSSAERIGLQGLGQTSMRAKLEQYEGSGALGGFRFEAFQSGGFKEPRAPRWEGRGKEPSIDETPSWSAGVRSSPKPLFKPSREPSPKPSGDGSREAASQGPFGDPSKARVLAPWESAHKLAPGPNSHRNNQHLFSRIARSEEKACWGGGQSQGEERPRKGASDFQGFGPDLAAKSNVQSDAIRACAYPSFQEARARTGPAEGSESAATKSVPLDVLKAGGERGGSEGGVSESRSGACER